VSRLLVVEDDPAILRGLADNLAFESYDVETAADGETAYRLLRERPFDLVLLDLMLPNMSGYDLCRRVRQDGLATPIVMLTARGDESDRVRGLDLGGDDYITKPFSVLELLARIRAVLRRARAAAAPMDRLAFDDVAVDFRRYEARRGTELLSLTPKEFGLLRALASRPGEVVTRSELLDDVWGYTAMPTTRTIDTHVASLRAKVEADPADPRHLLTVFGVGYKWQP
jgi:DNA-binding response OmpR family regulator